MNKFQPFECVKLCPGMSLGHFTIQRSSHHKCQKSYSEKFQKILKSIILLFAIKSTPPRVISWEFSRIFQSSCFKKHIRTAASEIIWENRRNGFLFHRCSRPEILQQLLRKNSRKLSGKNLCWRAFFNFNYQNTL